MGESSQGPSRDEYDAFRDRYPMDDRAFDCLTGAPAEVQRVVVSRFKPRSEGDADYSALVMAFVRTVGAARQKGDKGKGRGRDYSRGRNERRGRDDTDDRDASPLTRFRDRYPMDDRAFAVLRGSPQSC